MLTQRDTACDPGKDWVRRPASAILWWCLPLGAATVVNVVALSPSLVAAAWSVAFSWMGTGCILNARRCSRLHCYISGPVFFAGAVLAGLIGLGLLNLGPHALTSTISGTLLLALLSFVPEAMWGKYARH